VVLTSESVDGVLRCGRSGGASSAVRSHGAVYILVFSKMKFGIHFEF